jgi:hypothetical protein
MEKKINFFNLRLLAISCVAIMVLNVKAQNALVVYPADGSSSKSFLCSEKFGWQIVLG